MMKGNWRRCIAVGRTLGEVVMELTVSMSCACKAIEFCNFELITMLNVVPN